MTDQTKTGRMILPPALWGVLIFVFLLSRAAMSFGLEVILSDIVLYFHYFSRFNELHLEGASFFGSVTFDYPPLMLSLILLPGWAASLFGQVDYDAYAAAFRTFMFLGDASVFFALPFLIRFTTPRLGPNAIAVRSALYILLTSLLPHVIFDRLDIMVAAVMIVSLALIGSGMKRAGSFFLGLGIALKLAPVFLAPPLVFWYYANRKTEGKKLDHSVLLAGLGGMLTGFLPYSIAIGPDAFSFVFFQSQRGLQLESVPASFGFFSHFFGVEIVPILEARAISLAFYGAETIKNISAFMLLGACSLCVAWQYVRRRSFRHESEGFGRAVAAGALLLCIAVLFSNVLSPQFFLWLIPLALALPFRKRRFALIAATLLITVFLTGMLFPYLFHATIHLKTHAIIMLLARNAMLGVFTIGLFLSTREELGA